MFKYLAFRDLITVEKEWVRFNSMGLKIMNRGLVTLTSEINV